MYPGRGADTVEVCGGKTAAHTTTGRGNTMYIGIRDIWFARGRFALISGVIALMSLMVVALSALTGGLGDQSISAVTRLPGQTVVVQQPAEGQKPSLTESALTDDQLGELLAGGGSEWGITTRSEERRVGRGGSVQVSEG